MAGSDVLISLSKQGPGTVKPEWVASMSDEPVVFACANPVPEIWPWEATEAGAAMVATGRADFPNQVNNSVCFPGLFRGALDVRAKTISDEMCFAAADAIAGFEAGKLSPERLVPSMEDWRLFVDVAVAVGLECQRQGLARIQRSASDLENLAVADCVAQGGR